MAIKSSLNIIDKGEVARIDFKAGIKINKANIKANKKTPRRTVTRTYYSVYSVGKVTNQYAEVASLAFGILAIANCNSNSHLAISKITLLDAAISTLDKFFAIFAAFANITLKKSKTV